MKFAIVSMIPTDLSFLANFPMPTQSFASRATTIENQSFLERRRNTSKSSWSTFRGHVSLSTNIEKIVTLLRVDGVVIA